MKYTFLGSGNMATAIASGITKKIDTCNVCMYDVDKTKYKPFAEKGFVCAERLSDALMFGDYIFLSVKPQNFSELLTSASEFADKLADKVFVTIAAGISTEYIRGQLGFDAKVVRAMPNTPMLIGRGVSALCRGKGVSDAEFENVKSIFALCGSVFVLDEAEMNKIISVTSSSPAYVYLFIKSIYDGALAQGMDYENMRESICDMVIGAAELVKSSPKTFDELITMVCSKGGTTIEAMKVFDEYKMNESVINAMKACTKRAEELGR